MEGLGVDAVGFNCGGDLAHAKELAEAFVAAASVPVFVEPNAGIPTVENGKTVFRVTPEEFAETIAHCARLGARVLGGCCGTTPAHIGAAVRACAGIEPIRPKQKNETIISSWCDALSLSQGPIVVGERINPTGKKRFKEAILANDIDYVLSEAKAQLDAGAHALDGNVGLPGIDEAAVMRNVV